MIRFWIILLFNYISRRCFPSTLTSKQNISMVIPNKLAYEYQLKKERDREKERERERERRRKNGQTERAKENYLYQWFSTSVPPDVKLTYKVSKICYSCHFLTPRFIIPYKCAANSKMLRTTALITRFKKPKDR